MCVLWCTYQDRHHFHAILFDDVHVPQAFLTQPKLKGVEKYFPIVDCSA